MRKALIASLAWMLILAGCGGREPRRQVVVYTSVDQVFSEPVLEAFEAKTGIRVLAVYDVEAAKTVGLAQRLLAEKANPQADVFWNGEFSQTLYLEGQGVLAETRSPAAADLPEGYLDAHGYWIAIGGRARVLLVNTDRLGTLEKPASFLDLLAERYPAGSIAMPNPVFGTASTQAAAMYALQGQPAARAFYAAAARRGVQVVEGNSVVRDLVESGQAAWGVVDTDDACVAIRKGAPVEVVFPDQGEGQMGTLIIPNSVARVANGPHPAEGQALVDYLVSREAEVQMVQLGWIQIPARPLPQGVTPACYGAIEVRGMSVSFEEIYRNLAAALADMQEIFVR